MTGDYLSIAWPPTPTDLAGLTVPSLIELRAQQTPHGTGGGFKQGRDFAAWLGLVPKQESTGDRTKLGKIPKRGNKYLRTLFVQAAHVVLQRRPAAAMRALWPWIEQASKRLAHRNLLAIALANKLARIAWAVHRIALSAQSAAGFRDRLSYAQLALYGRRVGAGLAALGVRRGDRVGVYCRHCPAAVPALFDGPSWSHLRPSAGTKVIDESGSPSASGRSWERFRPNAGCWTRMHNEPAQIDKVS